MIRRVTRSAWVVGILVCSIAAGFNAGHGRVHAAGQGYSYGDAWVVAALVLWVLGNALGSRERLALLFDSDSKGLARAYEQRQGTRIPPELVQTGPVKEQIRHMPDLKARELWAVGPLIALIIFFGFYPQPLLNIINPAVHRTLVQVHATDPVPPHPARVVVYPVRPHPGSPHPGSVVVSVGKGADGTLIMKELTP